VKKTELSILIFLAGTLVFNYSNSYAQENDGSAFVLAQVGANIGINNCIGNCSAEPSGLFGLGVAGQKYSYLDLFIFRELISINYSRFQFNSNANKVSVVSKAIHIHVETAFEAYPKYMLGIELGPDWSTARSMNTPDQTILRISSRVALLYQVANSLYVSLGTSSLFIRPANQPDLLSNTVDVGLRWHL